MTSAMVERCVTYYLRQRPSRAEAAVRGSMCLGVRVLAASCQSASMVALPSASAIRLTRSAAWSATNGRMLMLHGTICLAAAPGGAASRRPSAWIAQSGSQRRDEMSQSVTSAPSLSPTMGGSGFMAEKTYLSTEHFRFFTLLRRRLRPALVVYIGGCRSARKLLQAQLRQAKGSLRATCNCTVTTRSCGSSAAGRAVDAPRSGHHR